MTDVAGGAFRRTRGFVHAVARVLHAADAPSLASSVAYYALLSSFPLALLGSSVAASFLDQADVQASLGEVLHMYLPQDAAAAIHRTVAEAVRVRRSVGAVALLAFLWAGSAATGAVRHALNRVLGVSVAMPLWQRKLVDLGTTVLFAVLVAASLSLAVLRAVFAQLAPALGPRLVGLVPEVEVLGGLGPPLLGFMTLLLAYRILPARQLPWRPLAVGALTGTLALEVARAVAFRAFEGFARYQPVYGSLAGVIVFLVWVYAASLLVLVGAAVATCAAGQPQRSDA
ncbi:MAG: YihY/virulence factor BrkB family protein [Armatimonadota bacterium]|nr:YihY/virulence factor BrkB family protein [Armatimonadota bacterium]MDW8155875.1 YihY/virulence factor BrkB family protein [Armatimonadota bacterium]